MEYLKIGIILTSIVANFLLGLLVIRKNSKNIVNLTLAGFAWTFAIWSLSLFFYDYPMILSSLFWIKVTYAVVILGIIGFLYYFGYIFPDGKKPPLIGQVAFSISALFFLFSLFFTNLFVQGVVMVDGRWQTTLGPVYPFFIIFDSIFGFWGLGMLIKKYIKAKGRIKGQLKYIFLGLALFIIVVLILDAFIPLLTGNSNYFSISTVGSLFFVGFSTYAMIKHRLLAIRIAMQEVLSHVLTALIICVISFASAVTYWVITGSSFKSSVLLVTLVVGVLLSLFFNKVVILSKLIVSKLMRQPFYDFEKTVLDISLSLAASLELNKLVDVICLNLSKYLGITDMAVIFYDTTYQSNKKIGFTNGLSFLKDSFFLAYLEKYQKMIILEEMKFLIDKPQSEEEKLQLKQLYANMEHSNVALVIPWMSNSKLLGALILGNKKSEDPFTVQDIDLLNTISFQSLNAIQNAVSYEKIKQFNMTLTEEISKATADLKLANQKLQMLDKLKDDFVSVASHELRTPMTAIRSYVWMALNRPDVVLTDKMKKYLSRTLVSTERLINLVNDMLNVSRIEAGSIEIRPESFDIQTLSEEVMVEVGPKASEKSLRLEVLKGQPILVFADKDKVHQVLLNLIGNSLKFTPAEGKINLGFFPDGKMVDISVKDNGVGISKDDQSRLFKKFERLDNSYISSATSGGTGLGLFISKSLIELMGGKIWASSEGTGRGATFTFSLPQATPEVMAQAEKYTKKPAGETKILEPVVI